MLSTFIEKILMGEIQKKIGPGSFQQEILVKLMNCEKFTVVHEVRFTLLYKTCNFTISGGDFSYGMLPEGIVWKAFKYSYYGFKTHNLMDKMCKYKKVGTLDVIIPHEIAEISKNLSPFVTRNGEIRGHSPT
jgi:hypothetical protein